MKFNNLGKVVSGAKLAISRGGLVLKQHAPTIMVVAGTAGVVIATVLACRETLKVEEIMNDANSTLDDIERVHLTATDDEYTPQDYTLDKVKLGVRTGAKLVKLYAPAIVVGSASIGCILGAHGIMVKRNQALGAAYLALQNAYDKYRERVVEKYGKDEDISLRNGLEKKVVEAVDKDGKVTRQEETYVSSEGISEYAKIFDEYNPHFSKDPAANLVYLRSHQNWANDVLKAKGFLFLNEVYEDLGFPCTSAGQIVGWVYDEKNPSGDNFVDFGIYDKLYNSEAKRDFINGHNPCVLLDFNVDGPIYQKLDDVYSKRA